MKSNTMASGGCSPCCCGSRTCNVPPSRADPFRKSRAEGAGPYWPESFAGGRGAAVRYGPGNFPGYHPSTAHKGCGFGHNGLETPLSGQAGGLIACAGLRQVKKTPAWRRWKSAYGMRPTSSAPTSGSSRRITAAPSWEATKMDTAQLSGLTNFIWNIADDVLRDVYVRGKYRDVILPMTVLRRLDAVLEPTKQAVLAMKRNLDAAGIANQEAALRQ